MKRVFLSILMVLCPAFLFSQVVIDSVEAVTPRFMESAANDLRIVNTNEVLTVGGGYFIRQVSKTDEFIIEPNVTDVQVSDMDGALNSISKQGSDIYIAGDEGMLIRYTSTEDYEILDSDTESNIKLVENCNGTVCYVDENNTVYTSIDFQAINRSTLENNVNDIFYYESKIYLACDNGMLAYSENSGNSWNEVLLDTMKRNIYSIAKGSADRLYFTGELLMHTDLDLENRVVADIDFDKSNIEGISDFYFIDEATAGAIIKRNENSYDIGIYFATLDTISSIGVGSDQIRPRLHYSEDLHRVCVELANERIAICSEEDFDVLFSVPFSKYQFPELNLVSDILSIDDNNYLAMRNDTLSNTNIASGKTQPIHYFDTKNNKGKCAKFTVIGNVEGRLLMQLDSVEAMSEKLILGTRTLMYSDDNGLSWDAQTEPDNSFQRLTLDRDVLSYNNGADMFKVSFDGAKTWIDIPWLNNDTIITYQIIYLDENTYISNPLFMKSPSKVEYYKTTDKGANWTRLEWFDNPEGQIFKSLKSEKSFYVFRKDLILYLDPENDHYYVSKDGFESWQELSSFTDLNTKIIMHNQADNGKYYFSDMKNIYLSEDDFETIELIPHKLDMYPHFGEDIESTLDNKILYRNNGRRFVYSKLDNLLSILDLKEDNYTELKVYPNPASEYLRLSGLKYNFNIGMIIDASGKERQLVSDFDSDIDVSALESGCYFIILIDNSGKAYKAKFLISK